MVIAFTWSGKYWERDKVHPVFFSIQDQHTYPTSGVPSKWGKCIKKAAKTWNEAGANYTFEYNRVYIEGDIYCKTFKTNDTIAGTVYKTMPGYPDLIYLCETAFSLNCQYPLSTRPSATEIDVQSTILHEFGHWLNLKDIYSSDSAAVVMYGNLEPIQTKDELTADDILGIKWIYPFSAWVSCSANVVSTDLPYEVVTGGYYMLGPVSNGGMWEWKGKLNDVPVLTSLYIGKFSSHPYWGTLSEPPTEPFTTGHVRVIVDGVIVYSADGVYSYLYNPYGFYYNMVETPQGSLTNLTLPASPKEVIVQWIAPSWPYEITSGDSTLTLIEVQQDFDPHTECPHPLNAFCRTKLLPYDPTILDSKISSAPNQSFVSNEIINKNAQEDKTNFTNYPNPFYNKTEFTYNLSAAINPNNVSLNIYNVLGQKVRTIVNGNQLPGKHTVVWDRLTDKGDLAGNGIYICRLQAGANTYTKKVVILK